MLSATRLEQNRYRLYEGKSIIGSSRHIEFRNLDAGSSFETEHVIRILESHGPKSKVAMNRL